MKNYFALFGITVIAILTFSCKDKNSKGAISPDYSATGNPYPNNQTVTGSSTYTSPATQNTSFIVGDIGWSNPTCISTNSMALRATKDNIDVIITFNAPATTGTYNIAPSAGANACTLVIYNAPNQPAGVYWYGKSGSVFVTQNGTSISAILNNVVCTQKEFNFPQVLISGKVGCNQ